MTISNEDSAWEVQRSTTYNTQDRSRFYEQLSFMCTLANDRACFLNKNSGNHGPDEEITSSSFPLTEDSGIALDSGMFAP